MPIEKPKRIACTRLAQLTASAISALKMDNYFENQYAEEVWTPNEFEWGEDGFTPSCPVLGHPHAGYAHKGFNTIA
jgi:hypothetical protein